MKCVILAGGKGTRISEYTKSIPKPMIKIGSKPMIEHIINYYIKYGFRDFIIAGGYKYSVIKNFFKKKHNSVKIRVINTGISSLTGKRIMKLKNELKNTFMLTYGDGLSNIDLNKLLKFHKKNKKKITMTAVHPPARFGELEINNNIVKKFEEKPQLQKGWINGGFFVVEPEFFDLINDDSSILEKEPLEKVAMMGQLMAYKHDGFWHCMDTKRDRDSLESLWKTNNAPWK